MEFKIKAAQDGRQGHVHLKVGKPIHAMLAVGFAYLRYKNEFIHHLLYSDAHPSAFAKGDKHPVLLLCCIEPSLRLEL